MSVSSKTFFCASTYRKQAATIAADIKRRNHTKQHATLSDHYSTEDRNVAEALVARELLREFLSNEM